MTHTKICDSKPKSKWRFGTVILMLGWQRARFWGRGVTGLMLAKEMRGFEQKKKTANTPIRGIGVGKNLTFDQQKKKNI